MTALTRYTKLESTGLWREAPDDQRREVIVRMGDATLMLADPRSEAVLSHWSLPAVIRQNPGERPAVYAPGTDAAESLEISDDEMIAALKTVQAAVRLATPRPGRLRGLMIWGSTLAILGAAAWFLPGALVAHTASVVPAAKRAEIGQNALDDVTRLTGAPCDGEMGLPALARLAERVFGPEDTPILYILPEGLSRPAHLPGGVILLPKSLTLLQAPDALAGAALAEGVAARTDDPMLSILNHAGLKATFDLLTSGDLPDGALGGYGEAFLKAAPMPVPQAELVAAFEAAQVPLSPFAQWRDPAGSAGTQALIAADPFKGLIPSPLLPDDDWIALQSVCSG